jgi:hypothetical protein
MNSTNPGVFSRETCSRRKREEINAKEEVKGLREKGGD